MPKRQDSLLQMDKTKSTRGRRPDSTKPASAEALLAGSASTAAFQTIPLALTVAGSDCSSGAGLQADLKTLTYLGVYGLTVVTCVVSEVPGQVRAIHEVSPAMVADQLTLLLEKFPVAALKTGMLYSKDVVCLVADALAALPEPRRPRLVVDPVMVATSGDPLLQPDAVTAYEQCLFPLADLITPNIDEAAVLLKSKIQTEAQLRSAAEALYHRYGCAVLLKGGHLRGATAVDVLRDAQGFAEFAVPFVPGVSTHGTGCTYSAAITGALARGAGLRDAVRTGKKFVTAAIRESFRWGRGRQRVEALNHLQSH